MYSPPGLNQKPNQLTSLVTNTNKKKELKTEDKSINYTYKPAIPQAMFNDTLTPRRSDPKSMQLLKTIIFINLYRQL